MFLPTWYLVQMSLDFINILHNIVEAEITNVITQSTPILSAMPTDIFLAHYSDYTLYRNWSRLCREVPSVGLSFEPRLVGLADYQCDLHCYSHSLVLFCSPFWVFTLVLIHNEYQRSCNINKSRSLGCWVYLRTQIKRTTELRGSVCVCVCVCVCVWIELCFHSHLFFIMQAKCHRFYTWSCHGSADWPWAR